MELRAPAGGAGVATYHRGPDGSRSHAKASCATGRWHLLENLCPHTLALHVSTRTLHFGNETHALHVLRLASLSLETYYLRLIRNLISLISLIATSCYLLRNPARPATERRAFTGRSLAMHARALSHTLPPRCRRVTLEPRRPARGLHGPRPCPAPCPSCRRVTLEPRRPAHAV